MSTSSSDAAEQIVKIYLEGIEVALKVSGIATKNVAAALYAIAQDKNKTRGKVRLTSMLKSGKDLKIFTIKEDEIKKFSEEAKRYGVLYCALVNKDNKSPDGLVDIMVRAEDAPKVNRIVDRFKLSTIDVSKIEKVALKNENKQNITDFVEEKSEEDLIVEDLLGKNEVKETTEETPSISNTVDDILSEPSSKSKNQLVEINNLDNELESQFDNLIIGNSIKDRPSVRAKFKEIKEEMKMEIVNTETPEIKNQKENTKTRHSKQRYKKSKHSKGKEKNKNIAKHLKTINRGGR